MSQVKIAFGGRLKAFHRNKKNNGDKLDKITLPAVSVITATNRSASMGNVFENYLRQNYAAKELIIILNNNSMDLQQWKMKALENPGIRVFQLDEEITLGECLNFAIEQSSFDYVAKFDDDDYYGAAYLETLMPAFVYTDAGIVGKRSRYLYFESTKSLAIGSPNYENRYVDRVSGASLIIKKEVFKRIRFPNLNRGEDTKFQLDCRQNGVKIYSGNKKNMVYMRHENKESHTWKIEDHELLKQCQVITHTDDYISYLSGIKEI